MGISGISGIIGDIGDIGDTDGRATLAPSSTFPPYPRWAKVREGTP
jgi:hypothetical protein